MNPGLKFKQPEGLKKNHQFRQVYTRGRRLNGPHLTIFFMPNQLQLNRLGLSVSKKRFKLSTRRHYIQRRLREAWRLNQRGFLPGYDIVISAQRFTPGPIRFAEIENELLSLAKKARLFQGET